MSLFDQVLNAVQDQSRQGNEGQLSSALQAIQQSTGGQGLQGNTTGILMSTLGRYVQSALQQKRAVEGEQAVDSVLNAYSGTQPNPQAVQAIFSPSQQQQATQDLSQQTGLNSQLIAQLLPVLLPVILQFLQTGASNQTQTQAGGYAPQGGGLNNPVLRTFLDGDRDGDVDMGDMFNAAAGFLNNRR
ncbi:DUF937 domain-containing protein [Leptolyngbya sp. FACHB-261]|uniref:DUF937 domain-containing protein n=1 Tax=Leptolyngbya sp. FACHB-261 TaxID=2692806 RepID=UPI0016896C8B|nr:DUF937 domain-containing protein [Leptolyngbya sp. FACHB-261]MBD2103823.1 DUF937 domain-containing protein [Leptolyngbya sp. FACHB-261]